MPELNPLAQAMRHTVNDFVKKRGARLMTARRNHELNPLDKVLAGTALLVTIS